MTTAAAMQPGSTEAVVHAHLEAFLAKRGIPAIVADYDEQAVLYTESRVYRGKGEVAVFFESFIDSLPPGAIEQFAMRSFWARDDLAFLTWTAGKAVTLGTDTFIVRDGRIRLQTVSLLRPQP